MGTRLTSEVVRCRTGLVRGGFSDGNSGFLGIPFAARPVGGLRFGPPAPADSWDGVREADVFGPPPPQIPPEGAIIPDAQPRRHHPDDWLTVNVWTPDPTDSGLPVMVYLYGGAYRAGHSAAPTLDGSRFAAGGVVLVTGNHRVGMEGYASLAGAPENRALLDQIALLEWVQDNVAAFGGDPSRVTVFGESAGAGAVANLMASPAARGLFGGAIVQSLPGTYFTPRLARDISAELVAPLGRPATADDLRDIDPTALARTAAGIDARMGPVDGRTGPLADRWGPAAAAVTAFSPVAGCASLPEDPWTALAAGAARDVQVLVGHTRDEWQLFLVGLGLLGQITDDDADWALRTFGPGADPVRAIRAAQPSATAEELFTLVQSDWLFRMPSVHLADAQLLGGGQAHLYELAYPAPAAGGVLGACHALDIALAFGTLGAAPDFFGEVPPPEAIEVSAGMQSAWLSMATDGHPRWPAFDDRELTGVFRTGEEPEVIRYPETASRTVWSEHRFAPLDLLG